jgi:phospholipase C
MYWMTGTPGNTKAEKVPADGFGALPTIFDRLDAKGVSWKVYIQNYRPAETFRVNGPEPAQVIRAPILAFARFVDDPRLSAHVVPLDDYYADLAKGTLPAVSYVVPSGPSEHPPGRVQSGEAFVGNVVTALKSSTSWPSSAFMWSYDDWGGWYDHVSPPKIDDFGPGFRVPALLVSPYAKRGVVDHTQLDHTSMLKFIESNWGLRALSTRDARANDLTSAFDFGQTPRPPQLLSSEAQSPTVVSGHSTIIYPAYGGAVLVALAFVGVAAFRTRRRRRQVAA